MTSIPKCRPWKVTARDRKGRRIWCLTVSAPTKLFARWNASDEARAAGLKTGFDTHFTVAPVRVR